MVRPAYNRKTKEPVAVKIELSGVVRATLEGGVQDEGEGEGDAT